MKLAYAGEPDLVGQGEKANYKRGGLSCFFSHWREGVSARSWPDLGPRRPVVAALLKVLVMTSRYLEEPEQMEQGAEGNLTWAACPGKGLQLQIEKEVA